MELDFGECQDCHDHPEISGWHPPLKLNFINAVSVSSEPSYRHPDLSSCSIVTLICPHARLCNERNALMRGSDCHQKVSDQFSRHPPLPGSNSLSPPLSRLSQSRGLGSGLGGDNVCLLTLELAVNCHQGQLANINGQRNNSIKSGHQPIRSQ